MTFSSGQNSGDVSQRDRESGAALGDAQAGHRVGLGFGVRRFQREGHCICNYRVGAMFKQRFQERVLAQRKPAEEGTVAERARENHALCVRRHKSVRFKRSEGALGARAVKRGWRRGAVERCHSPRMSWCAKGVSPCAAHGAENG